MKKLFNLILLIPFITFSQPENSKFQFTQIDSINGTKAQLYTYAHTWLAKTYTSSKSVIQMEDKDAGTIIGNGVFIKRENSIFGNQVGLSVISYTISIDVKDNKYRCIVSDLSHSYIQQSSTYIPGQPIATAAEGSMNHNGGSLDNESPRSTMSNKQWQQMKTFAKDQSVLLLSSLNKAMKDGQAKTVF